MGFFGLAPAGRVPDGARNSVRQIGAGTYGARDCAGCGHADGIACVDPRDPFYPAHPAALFCRARRGLEGVRIACRGFWSVVHEETEIVPLCHEAAQAFRSLGASYSEPSIRIEDPHDPLEPDPEYSRPQVHQRVRAVNPNYLDPMTWASKLPRDQYEKLTIYIRDRSDRPNELDYAMSILPSIRYRQKDRLDDLFQRIDLLLCPTITRRAIVCGREHQTPWQYTAFTHIVNVSGYCAASVPAGFYKGMPVGLQIMGRPGEESLVLRAARAFERERPWAQHRPKLA